jgi:hypothetical protein
VAYPIGRFVIDQRRNNPAFEIVQEKLYKYPNYLEEGLKILPFHDEHLMFEKRKAPEHSEASIAD